MRLGVCWYPEQWPEAWWAEDARQMAELGISQVRIAEFAWSRIEPEPLQFDWAWLDRAVETLAEAGLKIVMGTPTATPPKWMIDLDPSILAMGADGRMRAFGSRRHYDFSSNAYLAEACRITRAMAQRYGRHPAVIAWQTDNEYGCHDTVLSYSPQAVRRFRRWLAERYVTVEALNSAWATAFWSQEYRSFDAIDAPNATVTEAHPAHCLDYRRFASDEVVRFNHAQCEILREHSPGRVIAHNFMFFFTEFDHRAVAADLDVAAWDSYPLGALENFWFNGEEKQRWLRTGHPDFASFHHALYRTMSRDPFWVMEQQPGPVNWGAWNPAPAPGMVRLWSWEAFAHGADVVSYFRWRQARHAQEQMHAGLQTPDRRLAPGGAEARQVAVELRSIPVCKRVPAPVALVFDYKSRWMTQIQPQGADADALRTAFEAYSLLRGMGVDVDIVSADAACSGYALVVVPALQIAPEGMADALERSGAQVVLYARSGSKSENAAIAEPLPPGVLRSLIDITVSAVESLRPGFEMRVEGEGAKWQCRQWREFVEAPKGVAIDAQFADGSPALLRAGRVRYLAGHFDGSGQRHVLLAALRDAGVTAIALPEGLRLTRRGDLLFACNYDSVAHTVPCAADAWLLGHAAVAAHGVSVARMKEGP